MTQPTISKTVLLQRVKTAVQTLAPQAEIILYGSRARGTAHTESDWDFLILLPSPRDKALEDRIKDSLYDIELETNTVLSSLVRSKEEWQSARYSVMPFKKQVEMDGIAV